MSTEKTNNVLIATHIIGYGDLGQQSITLVSKFLISTKSPCLLNVIWNTLIGIILIYRQVLGKGNISTIESNINTLIHIIVVYI